MGRIRSIKPDTPQSGTMTRLSREARLCFILLWTLADDAGRLRGNPAVIAGLIYPGDMEAGQLIDGWLSEIEREESITRYKVGRDEFIQIEKWLDHQRIEKPSKSRIPPPPENSVKAPRMVGEASRWEGNGGEGSGVEEGRRQAPSSSTPAAVDPPAEPTPAKIARQKPIISMEVVRAAVTVYNAMAARKGLPQAEKITDRRATAIRARLVDAEGIEGWSAAMRRVEAHCRWMWDGSARDGWRADLDFFLQPTKFQKLIEGSYDRDSNKSNGVPVTSAGGGFAAVAAEIRAHAGGGISEPDHGGGEAGGDGVVITG